MASKLDAFADELDALLTRHWGTNWELGFDTEDGSYFINVTLWPAEEEEAV